VSINDLVKEEAQRQIDLVIEEIPFDASAFSSPIAKARLLYKDIDDFLLGFEYGHISEACTWYYRDQVEQTGRGVTEAEQVTKDVRSVIQDRLPEIRRSILRAVTSS
jgi:hypothetical protein